MKLQSHSYQEIYNTHGEDTWLLISVFIKEMDTCLIKLDQAIKENDIDKARAELHQMIGAARILNDDKLEMEILRIQEIVKSRNLPKDGTNILENLESFLDNLFNYLSENRPNYHLHLLAIKESTVNQVKEMLEKEVAITCTFSATLEGCKAYLAATEPDIILVEYEYNNNSIEDLSNHLMASFINSPILLLTNNTEWKKLNLSSKYSCASGCVLKSDSSKIWIESIKTIANGRDYW